MLTSTADRIDFEEKATYRIPPFHQRSVITFEQREIETAIFDRAAVYKKMLIFPRARETPGAPINPQRCTVA